MSLKAQLQSDLKDAIRAQDGLRKAVIRLTLAAITNAEVEKRAELDDTEVLEVLRKEARKRVETVEELRGFDRPDRLTKEEAELAVLEAYLPRMLTRQEIIMYAQHVIADAGATSMAQLGPVMARLMSELRGRADGRVVNAVVRELLGG